MKILFLAAADNIHTVRWVNALSKRGHDVYLITNKNHLLAEDKINEKVKVYFLYFGGTLGYYLNFFQLKKLCRKINPDVINTHYASGYGTLARLANLTPNVLSLWGSDVFIFPYKSKVKYNILRRNIDNSSLMTSSSQVMAEHTKMLMNKDLKIRIVPFGIDTDAFFPKNRVNYNNHVTIGIVKSLEKVYGIDDVIKAFSILERNLNESEVNVTLEIYGKGTQLENLKALSREYNIENVVNFHGYKKNNELPEALNKIDIFCLGSISESFGVSAIEAMASGLPVIATDTPGFKEIIKDKESGFIVPKKDPEDMAKKMHCLVMDANLRYEMGVKGRRRVEKLYDWEENVTCMEEVYKEVLS
ncbi:hypothetical protein AAV35_002535 [Salimicrobium jeotgali]|uniref:Group 1 glycosyl transferase n=1 Tax=Salimicrobium jeotgali TaxID=1230341 RepID=K2G7W9_9BACI|nr:glycosyltransferase family 4 protein [Salimicrobium jeotgali]AKG03775.1 hypothetical protein AAV35_002535 [Salimicrobium jeotgali]EKE31258.1 group 1 glycosyl transferase [Salimicrobium jeotgali]MBM7697070.1 glycosyltransferase involved in cell wall biosynthesis [Salimicrobium jeotgali]